MIFFFFFSFLKYVIHQCIKYLVTKQNLIFSAFFPKRKPNVNEKKEKTKLLTNEHNRWLLDPLKISNEIGQWLWPLKVLISFSCHWISPVMIVLLVNAFVGGWRWDSMPLRGKEAYATLCCMCNGSYSPLADKGNQNFNSKQKNNLPSRIS